MNKVWDISVKTNSNVQPLEDKQENKYTNHDVSQADKDIISFVATRKKDMWAKRGIIDKNWSIYQRQFESIYIPYRNGKTRSNIPLEHTVIEHFISETRGKKPKIAINTGNKGNETAIKLLRRVKDYDFKKNNRSEQLKRDDYICGIFGTSVMHVGFETKARVIEDLEFKDSEIVTTKKLQKNSNIVFKSVELNYFYADDRVENFEDAVDCIYEYKVPYDTFMNMKYDKNYKNIEKITGTNERWDQAFTTKEYVWAKNVVNITVYYNTEKDRTITIANDEVIIRDTPLLNPFKILPFCVRQFFYNPNNIHGRGICELLLSTKSEINTLKEMAIEGIKRSNNEIFAMWGDLEFDWQELNFNNTLLKFNGQLQWNFQQISGTPPNQALFNYIQALYTEVAYWVGIDITSISGTKENTAYQTAVRQEMQSKVVNNVLENRDMAYKRLGELYVWMLQFFYPRKLARKLIPLKQTKKWLVPEQIEGEYPTLKLDKEQLVWDELITSKQDNYLEVTPEMIRWEFVIEIETNYNQPTLQQVQRESITAWLWAIAEVEALAQTSEVIAENKEDLIDEIKRLYNLPMDSWDIENKDVQEEKEQLMNMIRGMTWTWWEEQQGPPAWHIPQWGWEIQAIEQQEEWQRQDILQNKAPETWNQQQAI